MSFPPHQVYSEELARAFRRGYPIADPHPGFEDGEYLRPVGIGDVGYIHPTGGDFIRLFNVHLDPGEDGQPDIDSLPEGFRLSLGQVRRKSNNTPVWVSHSVVRKGVDVEVSEPFFGGSAKFESSNERGAILATPDPIDCADALNILSYKLHMKAHVESWHQFARENGHNIELEHITLVTGVDKTTSWATAVFAGRKLEAGFGLQVQFAEVGVGVQLACHYSWQSTSSALVNSGPVPARSDTSLGITGTDQSGITSAPLNLPAMSSGAVASSDSERRPINTTRNQSIFIRHMRAKRRRFWPGLKLEARGESDVDEGDNRSYNEDRSGARVLDSDVISISSFPPHENFSNYLDTALDYILEHSTSDIAIAHDEDLDLLPANDATAIAGSYIAFKIVVEDGCGMLRNDVLTRHLPLAEASVESHVAGTSQDLDESGSISDVLSTLSFFPRSPTTTVTTLPSREPTPPLTDGPKSPYQSVSHTALFEDTISTPSLPSVDSAFDEASTVSFLSLDDASDVLDTFSPFPRPLATTITTSPDARTSRSTSDQSTSLPHSTFFETHSTGRESPQASSSHMMKTTKRGRPFIKDTHDLFATMAVSLRFTTHRVRFRSIPNSFATDEAARNLSSLKFTQSNRGPDPRDPSRVITTTTTTTFSMTRDMAKAMSQHFMDARLIENAADPSSNLFKARGVYVLTPKGLHVLERFITHNGINDDHLSQFFATQLICTKLLHLERRSIDDEIIASQSAITALFRRFVGPRANYPPNDTKNWDLNRAYHERSKGIQLQEHIERSAGRAPNHLRHCFMGLAALEWLCDFTSVVGREEAAEMAAQFVRFGLITLVSDKRKNNDSAIIFTVRGSVPDGNSPVQRTGEFRCTANALYKITDEGVRVAPWDDSKLSRESLHASSAIPDTEDVEEDGGAYFTVSQRASTRSPSPDA